MPQEDDQVGGRPVGRRGQDPWRRVESLVEQWLDRGGSAGQAPSLESWLADEEAEVREQVTAWIEELDQPDPLDEGLAANVPGVVEDLQRALLEEPRRGLIGQTIGRYRLVGILGHGGMGVVYEAERADRAFDKRVALKVLPRGLETAEAQRRFLVERQVLARLEHPHIARLLDGGVTDEGYPYLVMELVEGLPIDRWCQDHEVDLRQRVELFLDVCTAVHYAHQNLIVHRDLKPSNILASEADEMSGPPAGGLDPAPGGRRSRGAVKLLDFGVAKALDDPDGEATRVQPMTPRYAAPEQRANQPAAIPGDIYSLGVVLDELLKAASPQGSGSSTLAADTAVISARARRELPEERFASVAELAADLRRALEGRPLETRPGSWFDRALRAARRHRLATVSAIAVVVLLGLGVSAVAWQTTVARQERDRARLEAARSRRIADLLSNVFSETSPYSETAGQLGVDQLLELSAEKAQDELSRDLVARGEILTTIASSLAARGRQQRALELAQGAVRDQRRADPPEPAALAEALRVLAGIAFDLAAPDHDPEALLTEAIDQLAAAEIDQGLERAAVEQLLGRLAHRAGAVEVALRHHRRALTLYEGAGSVVDAAVQRTHLGATLRAAGEPEEAMALQQQALAVLREELGDDHANVVTLSGNLALELRRQGRFGEALGALRSVLASNERLLGPEHAQVASNLSNLGRVLMDLGRFAEAEAPLRRSVAIRRRTTEAGGVLRVAAELNLASWQSAVGEHDRAVQVNRSALARFLELSDGVATPSTVRVQSLLAESLRRRRGPGDLDEAVALARSAVVAEEQMLEDRRISPLALAESYTTLGLLELDLGQASLAVEPLSAALELRDGRLAADNWRLAEVRIGLAQARLLAAVDDVVAAQVEGLLLESRAAELADDVFEPLKRRRRAVLRRLSERRRSRG